MGKITTLKYSRKSGKKYRVDYHERENLLEYEREGYYTVIPSTILDDELHKLYENELAQLEKADIYWMEREIELQNDPEYWESQLRLHSEMLTDDQIEIVADLANKKTSPANQVSDTVTTSTNTFKIQIASEVVRDANLSDTEFVLYAKLVQLYHRTGKHEEFQIKEFKKLMNYLNIDDNRTFKKTWNKLYKRGLILNEIVNLPKKNPLVVRINAEYIPKKNENPIKFTQLPHYLLDKYVLQNIGETGVRILYYLESYIDRSKGEELAYPSQERIADETNNSRTTVSKYIDMMEQMKILEIQKFKYEGTGEHNEDGIEAFIKYQNKYKIKFNKILKLREKWKTDSY